MGLEVNQSKLRKVRVLVRLGHLLQFIQTQQLQQRGQMGLVHHRIQARLNQLHPFQPNLRAVLGQDLQLRFQLHDLLALVKEIDLKCKNMI